LSEPESDDDDDDDDDLRLFLAAQPTISRSVYVKNEASLLRFGSVLNHSFSFCAVHTQIVRASRAKSFLSGGGGSIKKMSLLNKQPTDFSTHRCVSMENELLTSASQIP
jgi:hypothetical protein